VIRQQYRVSPAAGPGPLSGAAQRAARNLAGREAGCYHPLTWPCPGCGHQVTDPAPGGRPARAGPGHPAGCTRLARDQGADDALRREWLPRLILYCDDPARSPQRHWLAGPITDDCPRRGWHGYFRRHLATIGGNRATTACDDCPAGLNPAITVTVRFFSARPAGSEPSAVIRRRTRSDYPYPGRGQMMTWRLCWEHTAMLAEQARGGADADIAGITRAQAGQITAGLAARHWPPQTARLPGWPAPIRGNSAQHVPEPRGKRRAGTGRPVDGRALLRAASGLSSRPSRARIA
jgi:hypothetical protein